MTGGFVFFDNTIIAYFSLEPETVEIGLEIIERENADTRLGAAKIERAVAEPSYQGQCGQRGHIGPASGAVAWANRNPNGIYRFPAACKHVERGMG